MHKTDNEISNNHHKLIFDIFPVLVYNGYILIFQGGSTVTMAISNIMEEIVNNKILEVLKDRDCCKCEKCLDDIRALALNKLPSKYVSTDKGELFSRLAALKEHQGRIDLNIAVESAIEFVSSHPRHDNARKAEKEVRQALEEEKEKDSSDK